MRIEFLETTLVTYWTKYNKKGKVVAKGLLADASAAIRARYLKKKRLA